MNISSKIRDWLLKGDPSIVWQAMKDLLDYPSQKFYRERKKIESEGWGKTLLEKQDSKGTWANSLYSPKWISTTYTLAQLRRMGLPHDNLQAKKGSMFLLDKGFYTDGGINYFASMKNSETCVTGIVLSICSYFRLDDERLDSLARHLFDQQMPDGGWNCRSFMGDKHSSFHTTLSALEGLREFEKFKGKYLDEIMESRKKAAEFMLCHRLYKSDKTGKIVNPSFTRFSFPPRWYYDVLKGLEFFAETNTPWDDRFSDAVELLFSKQSKDGKWKLQNKHPGKVWFEMEKTGAPSRWNTLRALKVLKWRLKYS